MISYEPPSCSRDLSLDSYKLWLANKYKIEKSDVFAKYVVGDRMFDSLEVALNHAHLLDLDQEEKAKSEREAALKAAAMNSKKKLEEQEERNENSKRRYKKWNRRINFWGTLITICGILGFLLYLLVDEHIARLDIKENWNNRLARWEFHPPNSWSRRIDLGLWSSDDYETYRCSSNGDYEILFDVPGSAGKAINTLDESFVFLDQGQTEYFYHGEGERRVKRSYRKRSYRTASGILLDVELYEYSEETLLVFCEGEVHHDREPTSTENTPSNQTPPSSRAPQLTSRQSEIIRVVLSPNGFIDKKLHEEFWSQVPDGVRTGEEYKRFLAQADELLESLPEWHREIWLSAKASQAAGAVVRTEGYERAKTNLRKHSKASSFQLPKEVFDNAELILVSAASGAAIQTREGPTYVTADMIEQVLVGLDTSIARSAKLMNPDWEQR